MSPRASKAQSLLLLSLVLLLVPGAFSYTCEYHGAVSNNAHIGLGWAVFGPIAQPCTTLFETGGATQIELRHQSNERYLDDKFYVNGVRVECDRVKDSICISTINLSQPTTKPLNVTFVPPKDIDLQFSLDYNVDLLDSVETKLRDVTITDPDGLVLVDALPGMRVVVESSRGKGWFSLDFSHISIDATNAITSKNIWVEAYTPVDGGPLVPGAGVSSMEKILDTREVEWFGPRRNPYTGDEEAVFLWKTLFREAEAVVLQFGGSSDKYVEFEFNIFMGSLDTLESVNTNRLDSVIELSSSDTSIRRSFVRILPKTDVFGPFRMTTLSVSKGKWEYDSSVVNVYLCSEDEWMCDYDATMSYGEGKLENRVVSNSVIFAVEILDRSYLVPEGTRSECKFGGANWYIPMEITLPVFSLGLALLLAAILITTSACCFDKMKIKEAPLVSFEPADKADKSIDWYEEADQHGIKVHEFDHQVCDFCRFINGSFHICAPYRSLYRYKPVVNNGGQAAAALPANKPPVAANYHVNTSNYSSSFHDTVPAYHYNDYSGGMSHWGGGGGMSTGGDFGGGGFGGGGFGGGFGFR